MESSSGAEGRCTQGTEQSPAVVAPTRMGMGPPAGGLCTGVTGLRERIVIDPEAVLESFRISESGPAQAGPDPTSPTSSRPMHGPCTTKIHIFGPWLVHVDPRCVHVSDLFSSNPIYDWRRLIKELFPESSS